MTDINSVSLQAFLQEIENWELSLSREAKKLKQLRKICNNKLQINTIDIALLGIESELIQYRKAKDKKNTQNTSVIELYTALSKRFMKLIEKIGEAAENEKYQNCSTIDVDVQRTEQNNPNQKNRYLQGTFSYNVTKQPPKKKATSMIEANKCSVWSGKQKSRVKPQAKMGTSIAKNRKTSYMQGLLKAEMDDEENLLDITYQLKQIKGMMSQMQKEIRLHNHDELEKEISKVAHNNRKIGIQIKAIKDDNQFLLARMQNLKDEINQEKKSQAEMIRLFEAGKHNRTHITELSKEKNASEEVSDWVKVRL